MKHFFALTLLLLTCCFVSAQQVHKGADSTSNLPLSDSGYKAVFTNFSASVRNINKVWLQWDVDSAADGDYFIVERSTDGKRYETIGALRRDGNNNHYELVDMVPPNGADLYRVKYSATNGQLVYSKTIPLSLSGDIDFKFYPNPVDKLFIIRTEHAVDIQVIDAVGSIRLSKRLQAGIQVINISYLERGAYILRVADKESNRIISNQLIKN